MWVVDVEGTDRSPLGPEDARPTDPAWSPDGRSIVYVDRGTLRVVDLRSGRDRRLVGVSSDGIWLPSFHPDGTTILYTRVTPGGRHLELWTVPVRGGSPRRLKRDAAFGTWSPDGSTIAFRGFGRAVEPYLIWPYRTNGLFLMDRSGRQTRTVMRASGSMMAPIDWSQTRAAWAPDGSRLVFALYPGPDASVRVVELRSGHVTHIGCGTEPSWWDARTLLIERPAPCRGSTLTPRPIDLRSAATGSRR
jgi:Tol biopolymer transport system component